jgi:hypothetical protein
MVKNGDFLKTQSPWQRCGWGESCLVMGWGCEETSVHDVVKKLLFAMDIHCEIGRVVIYSLLLLCL